MSSFKKLLGIEFIKFADENSLKKVQACLDLEVDVNATDGPFDKTAAIKAATRGNHEVIRLLAATGQVDWNKADNHGWTALHVALYRGQEEVVRIILQQDNINFSLRIKTEEYTVAHSSEVSPDQD